MSLYSIQFYDSQRKIGAVLAVICLALLGGCASNTIDEAVPLAAAQPLPEPAQTLVAETSATPDSAPVVASQPAGNAPLNTGQYPNINVVPTGATAQLSDAETAAKRAELEGEAQVQQQRGESPEAYMARLRKLQKLGSTHAAATLKQIENSQ